MISASAVFYVLLILLMITLTKHEARRNTAFQRAEQARILQRFERAPEPTGHPMTLQLHP
jgi:hypothetical protein